MVKWFKVPGKLILGIKKGLFWQSPFSIISRLISSWAGSFFLLRFFGDKTNKDE